MEERRIGTEWDQESAHDLKTGVTWYMLVLLAYFALTFAAMAGAEAKLGTWSDAANRWEGEKSDANILICTSTADCKTKLQARAIADGKTKTSGYAYYGFQSVMRVDFTAPAPTCGALPAARSQTCPSGYTGTWQQQPQQSAYPTCAITWTPATAPTGACTLIPTGSATLSWTPPTQNTDGTPVTTLAGYRIVYGTNQTALTNVITVANPSAAAYIVSSLPRGTHYFAVKAYTTNGAESANSSIASKVIP